MIVGAGVAAAAAVAGVEAGAGHRPRAPGHALGGAAEAGAAAGAGSGGATGRARGAGPTPAITTATASSGGFNASRSCRPAPPSLTAPLPFPPLLPGDVPWVIRFAAAGNGTGARRRGRPAGAAGQRLGAARATAPVPAPAARGALHRGTAAGIPTGTAARGVDLGPSRQPRPLVPFRMWTGAGGALPPPARLPLLRPMLVPTGIWQRPRREGTAAGETSWRGPVSCSRPRSSRRSPSGDS